MRRSTEGRTNLRFKECLLRKPFNKRRLNSRVPLRFRIERYSKSGKASKSMGKMRSVPVPASKALRGRETLVVALVLWLPVWALDFFPEAFLPPRGYSRRLAQVRLLMMRERKERRKSRCRKLLEGVGFRVRSMR